MTLILSELYTSIQCEGPNIGKPTQFVRFAGCNMRCPGWPCDTQHAIDPAIWRHEAERLSPTELYHRVVSGPGNICLTGGEPFMQKEGDLQEFVEMCKATNMSVEAFTNGSFYFPGWALTQIQFIMDWKLKGSGEADTNVAMRLQNAMHLKRADNIKFVVVDKDDLEEALLQYTELMIKGCSAQFWVGAAWDRIGQQEVIDYMILHELPWRLNVQLHKYLWDPDERRV